MLLRRCSGGVATARVLQPLRRRGAVAASLAPSLQALQSPGCCSCGGVAAPSPPAPTVAAEGQESRLASLAEASTHRPPEHRRESAADPRQPVGCDGAATPPLRRLQHPGPGPPRYGCSRDSRMAPWRRVGRDSRASPKLRRISIVKNPPPTRRLGAAAPSVGREIDCSTPIPWHNHGCHEQHQYDSETAAPEPLLVWKHHRGGGVAAKASTPPVTTEASPWMGCEAPPREPRPISYDYNIHLNEHKK